MRINAITNEVTEGGTGALAVPVRIRSGRGGTDRSCGASLVFGAVARDRTGAIGGASRRGERRPRLERSADGVGAGVLNLAGGEGLDDLDRLEGDSGLCRLVRAAEAYGRSRRERRAEAGRWRRQRSRALPSPHAAGRWLAGFHDAGEEARREAGRAFIPASGEGVAGLWRVNGDLLQAVQAQHPAAEATLDMDATLVETHKREALYCYKHFKAYQPLNSWWAEQGLIVYSEFRDGNVPAGHEQLRVLKRRPRLLPAGVTKLYLRSDTAGYQEDFLMYCGEGKNPRFGVIEFAIGADVTADFKRAVAELPDTAWQGLIGSSMASVADDQQWAEVGYVPNWAGTSKRPDYHFLAIREPLGQLDSATRSNCRSRR